MAKTKFSVIIPTYTGEEHIQKCFDSIQAQRGSFEYEIVVVIDGPNSSLRDKVDEAKQSFKKLNISFTVHQFSKNRGRYAARLEGAKLAKFDRLLFIDDRVSFGPELFEVIVKSGKPVMIPNVQEEDAKNLVSRSMYLMRRRVYGKKWGKEFASYDISEENFEKSPKGTTGLWVDKDLFIDTCLSLPVGDEKHTNEDTRLFKQFLKSGHKIHRNSKAKIFYNPRSSSWNEITHVYHRGPRFVDYYLKPGTRFFPYIVLLLTSLLLLPLFIWKLPQVLIFGAAAILLSLAVLLPEHPGDLLAAVLIPPVLAIAFIGGIVKGLLLKLVVVFDTQRKGTP